MLVVFNVPIATLFVHRELLALARCAVCVCVWPDWFERIVSCALID